jgi:RNA polymerase sigma-54 factor
MGSMDFRADHRQQQAMSPRLQHAVRLLTLSSMDFAQAVHQAIGQNPFLEIEEGEGREASAEPVHDEPVHDGESDREVWQADGYTSNRRGESDDLGALDHLAVESSLASSLNAQLALQPLSQRDRMLARVIVESLDDDGYLRTELDELMALCELQPAVDAAEMALALQRVQMLEPAGVGARSVEECLRLQLPAIECPEQRALVESIIEDHLSLLAARDIPALARQLGRAPAEVELACDRIRHFDPRPGWRCGSSQVQYVVPDVIVRKMRGAWTVQLNPAIVPRVRLNQVYADMFKRARRERKHGTAGAGDAEVDTGKHAKASDAGAQGDEGNNRMADHLQEARWTLRNVEQRFSTILEVAQAIVERQKYFFSLGPMAMKPLGLREIAEQLGMHESTVSRVTNNKYMATPLGVFELKHFFSRAMPTANGGACTGTAIRGLIKDMIDAEAASAPLSDAEIARQLVQQGLQVARRTVTKYRQSLRIEAAERRRRHA